MTEGGRKDEEEQEAPASIICEGTHIDGDLKSAGRVHVDGRIGGTLLATSVFVGEKGSVEGDVVADTINVQGYVSGNIIGRVVELRTLAHVVGDTTYEELSIEKGACIDGRYWQWDGRMTVQVGDRFTKSDAPTVIWTVSRIITENYPMPHAILVGEGRSGRQITLAVSALETASMFKKLAQ